MFNDPTGNAVDGPMGGTGLLPGVHHEGGISPFMVTGGFNSSWYTEITMVGGEIILGITTTTSANVQQATGQQTVVMDPGHDEGQYRRVERGAECTNTQIAVVIDGRKAGTILHICSEEKCKTHGRASRYEASPQEREQRGKIALAARIQKEARIRILQAVRQELRGTLSRPDFEMVALDFFRRLGHDNHHRLFQVYGWEEKKIKTSWAGFPLNMRSWCTNRFVPRRGLTVNRLMVTCALVPDLYYSGFGGDEVLSKDSNLSQAASRYKVGATKIASTVTAELSAKKKRTKPKRRVSKRGR